MTDRFNLEQNILSCWGVVDDIELLYKKIGDSDELNRDYIMNYLLSLRTIYDAKFDNLFKTFESMIEEEHAKNKLRDDK